MKTMKRVMSVILTFALVITLAAPTSTNAATHGNQIGHDSVKGIHLREKSKQLVIGESSQITVMNCKKNAKIRVKNIQWGRGGTLLWTKNKGAADRHQ